MPTMRWIEANKVVPVLCIIAIAGAAAYSLLVPTPRTSLDDLVGIKKTVIEGIVIADPDRREKVAMVKLRVDTLAGAMIYHSRPTVLLSVDPFTSLAYGDRITAEGTLKYPEPFDTDSGRTFDYPQYLRAQGVLYTMSFAKIEVIRGGDGNRAIAKLLDIKHLLERGINASLPAPESSLLGGLLIGDKHSLGATTTAAFRNAGVVHIIVLSGYNIALVMNAVLFMLASILPRIAAYSVAGLFIIGFAVMTGGSETTIRAVVMALIMMLASVLHRPKAALRALLFAAALMAISNPFLVLYDLSFQLSVLATLGLIVFADTIAARIRFVPKALGLREIVATTLATQVTVLPLLVLSVGQVSLVFLATNPLILPAVPVAMLTGFISSLVALVSPVLALPFSSVAYLILAYIINIATWFGSLPFASVAVPSEWDIVILPLLALTYLVIFVRAFKRKEPQRGS